MTSKRMDRIRLLVANDTTYWSTCTRLAGMDEVGRGPLAGCVMAACVIMSPEPVIDWVDDSKKLSEKRRESVYEEIMRTALFVGIGRAEPEEIDDINILNATKCAMRRAAQGCHAEIYLIDAVDYLGLDGREEAIIHGDALSYSIAAASIVAKVTRDREMREMDERYPRYGFASNKGYGTKAHIDALKRQGPCPIHRKSFIAHFV